MNDKLKNNIVHITLGIILVLVVFLLPLKANAMEEGEVKNFAYTGGIQSFTVPNTGYYQLEVWGAQGGSINSTYRGGYGGYATGNVLLKKGQILYLAVGGKGKGATRTGQSLDGGYNGGGKVTGQSSVNHMTGSGGGATHIATSTGLLSSLSNNKNAVLIVAGGGGGGRDQANHVSAARWGVGGNGGGYIAGATLSNNGSTSTLQSVTAVSGTQTKGYAFGQGESVTAQAAGGGGYYGGYSGAGTVGVYTGTGGGGSGYIGNSLLLSGNNVTKTMYCYSCTNSTDDNTRTTSTTNVSATAISNYAKSGDGYAKITLLQTLSGESRLSNIEVTSGVFEKEFDPDTYEYNVYLDSENYNINIYATLMDNTATVIGEGNYDIKAGTTDYNLVSTSEFGETSIYTLHIIRPVSNYKYLNSILVDGKEIENFEPENLEYTVNLAYNQDEIKLDSIVGRPSQTVDGIGTIKVPSGNSIKKIEVTSEDKLTTTTYTIHFIREHSSKLKSLSIEDYDLEPSFDENIYDYVINIMNSTLSLDVKATAYDEEATITFSGFGYIKASTIAKITITEPNCESTVYNVKVIKDSTIIETKYDFSYTDKIQTFTAEQTGYYRLETWGAQGGNATTTYHGGYGGYATGVVFLKKNDILYISVGGRGKGATSVGQSLAGGYNGGGSVKGDSRVNHITGSGGGATHMATSTGLLNTLSNNKDSVLIVAGGGGGGRDQANHVSAARWGVGGNGGGYIAGATLSNNGSTSTLQSVTAVSGTQTKGYAFGQGESVTAQAAGGGGYYGGYSGAGTVGVYTGTGGGGSGYIASSHLISYKDITKVMYCYNCKTSEDSSIYTETTTNYSISPTSYYAKSGDGYARITLLEQPSENNFLSTITVDKGTLSPKFDMSTLEYNVELTSEDDEITIGARLEDDTATLKGIGTFDVPAGTTQFPITVTAENGDIRVYTINVTRPASSNENPENIVISGLVPSLCLQNEKYCKLSNDFSTDIHSYTLTVPSRIKQLEFTVIKGHKYQKVTGEGVVSLDGGMNVITIEIMSEDGKNTATYTYNIERDMTGNANIESLNVIDPVVDVNFDPDITEYYFSIPNENTNVELDITLEDPEATYEIVGNQNFEVGLNVVSINVTAKNGETKNYTLNIYREQSGNTFLSSLNVSHNNTVYELNPTFNKIISTYTVNVPNEIDSILIDAKAEHSLTTIAGLGEYNLKTGTNTFQITSTSEDGSVQVYTVSVIRAKNDDATLKSLDILEATLSPEFESNLFEYYIDVNPGVTSLNLNPVPNKDTSTYKISGNSGFMVGVDNIVTITVTAENGNKQDYKIHVNRLPSTNTYLKDLNTDKYDMVDIFDKEIQDYDIIVENDVTSIKVNAVAEDSLSTVTGAATYKLKTGDNSISIVVIAEDGSSRTYNLNIYRKYSNNANLISLSTTSKNEFMPAFDKDEENYVLEVENDEKEITVLGVAEDKTATVNGNGTYPLVVGNNSIELTVTAEDKTTKTYTLTVIRKKSSNANASMIIAKESVLDPVFNKNETSYVLKVVEDVESLNLFVTLEDEASTYEVIGNENFVIGNNIVIVKVTAEDGTEKNYELNVLRQARGTTSNRLINLSIDNGVLTPIFDPDTNYYEVEVPYAIKNVTLSGELDDKNATVSGFGQHQLEVGQNVLAVQVTSVEGVVRYYQVVVTRKENDEARLSNLQVVGTTINPNFNKDVYEYNLITSSTELNILATTIDPNASYEIIGNENLTLGNNQVIIRVTAQDKVTTKDYVLNIEKEKSNNNNLKSLEVIGEEITPTFDKTTTVYYLEVERDIEIVEISAITDDINATIEGDGERNLSIGKNYLEVTVTSESGNKKVYTVIVTRKASSDNYLENLTVSSGTLTPEFNRDINDYEVTVPYEVEQITIDGIVCENATVAGFEKYDLAVGMNKIKVVVTAEDGTINIYNIDVIREDIVSSKLKDLSVNNYSLDQTFSSDVYDYNVVVDNEITSLDLNITTIDKNAIYVIEGNENFIVGMNEVKVIVTDSKGLTTSTYILNVNRQNYANTYLAYIYADNGTLSPTFEKTTLNYQIEVENDVEEINIFAEPELSTNILTGTGNYKLDLGDNLIALKVSTTTGVSRTYYVNVVRKRKTYNNLISLDVKANGKSQVLSPTFDKNTLSYKTTVVAGTPNIQIIATAEDGATISGIGNKMIKVGDNSFDIVVTAEDGSIKTYNLIVTREASTNNNLIDIVPSVGTLTPSFTYTNNEYSIKLDSSVSLLSFDVTTEDRYATVKGTDAEVVPDGESTRTIIVTAENKSTKSYIIHVYKDRTDEARLSSLKMSGYTFDKIFDKDVDNYNVKVPNNKNVVLSSEIEAIPLDSNATVTKTSSLVLTSTATNIYTIVVTAKDGFTTKTYTISIEREKGSDSSLSKLEFNYGEMSPKFIPTTTEYTLKLPRGVTTINASDVVAIPTDEDAEVSIVPSFEFTDDNNVYEIVVVSADGSNTTTYKVNLERLQSNDATLKEITTSTGSLSPAFDRKTLDYTVDVTDVTEEIVIDATPNDEKGIILSGTGTYQLDSFSKKISITVQAEDGTINIYNVTVNRSITTEKLLSDLYLSGECTKDTCPLTPQFSEDILEYSTTVENEITSVDISYVKKHEGQQVKVYNYQTEEEVGTSNLSLKTGNNTFRIDVINGIGEKNSYKLTIKRKLSNNNYLKTLEIITPQTELEFNKEQTEYFVSIPNEYDSVVLNYETEVSTSTVISSGTKYLTPGNNDVYVVVTAENGDARTYIIHVEKEKDYNNYLKSLTISSGVIYELTPKFYKTITNYTVNVPYEASTISLEGVPELTSTTVIGTGEKQLKVGVNSFTLTATAITGETLNYNVIINREKTTKLYLKNLKINNANLLETFNKDKFSYNVEADSLVTSLDMTVVPEVSDVKYKIIGNNNLVTGNNTILIVLENADKTVTTTYKLNVNKLPSSDPFLKSLKVNDKELINDNNYNSTSFTTTVKSNVDTINLVGIPNNLDAKVEGNGTYSLDYGDNLIKMKVTAEDGSILNYEVNIKREYDNDLLMISTDRGDLTPTFDKDTLDYYLEVERDITDITVVGVKSSNLTTLTGNGYYTLDIGENLISLVVSASDKTSKTYNVHVTRKLSSNNNLASLYVHEGVMKEAFDKDTIDYHLEVPNSVTKLTIDTEVEDSTATYEIIGNENLTSGDNTIQIKVTAGNKDVKTYTLHVVVQDEALFSNRLKSLTVNKGTLAPNFDPDTTSYTVTVTTATSSINVNGILESVYAKVTGLGNHELALGRNEIPIVVTSKDGKTRTYSVIVYRIESNDARLKSVTFDEGTLSPLFDKDTTSYTMTVDSSVSSLTEKVVPLVAGTTYTISGNKNIQTGETTVIIEATAGDGITKKTYTITVIKEKSTNNYLSTLTTNISTITPDFIKTSTGPYMINVGDDVNSIILDGKAESSTATVTGLGIHQINRGKNIISISVTSEVGTVRTYTVIVNKSLSNDNSLSFLGISDGDLTPEFDKDTISYTVEVDSEVEAVTILGIATNKYATVTGNGNYNLVVGDNIIPITVTAEDGSTKTYTVTVKKLQEASSKLLDIKAKEGILSPSFDKNTLEYTITVPNEVTSLSLETIKEDENATVKIENNENFIVGANQVVITVMATDNTTTIYKLNVIRQTASNNYLKEINLDKGLLNPEFDKLTQYYEVEVDSSVDHITITGVSEDVNATVSGNGMYMLEKGDNYIYLTVKSASGVERVYTVKVIRKQSNDALLKSLSISTGELTPSFDPMTNDYTVMLPEGINQIGISATASSKDALVTGTGEFAVSTGDNVYEVIVTAEDGTINTYTIHATKASSSNNNITNIIPSSGTLSPNYSNDISSYEVLVEEDISMIDFEVLLESSLAKVTGNEDIYLDYGDNDVLIQVEAEDGSVREVHINVVREKNITDILVEKDTILMAVGENYQLNPTVLPEDATNKELIYESSNTEVATVEDGLIVAKEIGDTQITISSAKNKDVKKVVQVTVLNLQLESSVYEVRRNDINIVIGAEEGESLFAFLSNMDNNESLIKFYDNNANQITDLENTRVATGQLITLEYNNQIYDQAWIVLRGDSSCDSNINVTDYTILVEQVLGKKNLEGYLFPSVDLEEDQIVNVTDSIKLTNYILGKLDSLNKSNNEE